MKYNFKGVTSALPTPFDQGKLDLKSFENLVMYQLKNGIDGFVVNGTTAESPTLSWEEVEALYHCTRKLSKDTVPVIIGTSSNSTEHAVKLTKKAAALGADAVLVAVPYFNKPPQRGLVQHFTAVAEASNTPVIVYNIPGRSVVSLTEESFLKLSEVKNIMGMKEASGDLKYAESLIKKLPSSFVKLSGDDGTYMPFLKLGGDGVISVMSNIITAKCAEWSKLAQQKNWLEAEASFNKYEKLINGMFIESNPIVPKWMLCKMGLIKSAEMRLPLVELDSKYVEQTTKLLKEFSLL
ncbi:MAG: 4-hydroxy-tetrahydrodipicolinate synthase [Pseudobdellovibrio sp.]